MSPCVHGGAMDGRHRDHWGRLEPTHSRPWRHPRIATSSTCRTIGEDRYRETILTEDRRRAATIEELTPATAISFSRVSKAKIEQTIRGDGDATLVMNHGGRLWDKTRVFRVVCNPPTRKDSNRTCTEQSRAHCDPHLNKYKLISKLNVKNLHA
jgi:hypothetical protein